MELIDCQPMSARISERQCEINQERCAEFKEHGSEYFSAERLKDGKYRRRGKRYQSPHWGNCADVRWVDPMVLSCLECERYAR